MTGIHYCNLSWSSGVCENFVVETETIFIFYFYILFLAAKAQLNTCTCPVSLLYMSVHWYTLMYMSVHSNIYDCTLCCKYTIHSACSSDLHSVVPTCTLHTISWTLLYTVKL